MLVKFDESKVGCIQNLPALSPFMQFFQSSVKSVDSQLHKMLEETLVLSWCPRRMQWRSLYTLSHLS